MNSSNRWLPGTTSNSIDDEPAAETDLVEAFDYIRARSPLNAAKWLRGLLETIGKLEQFAGHGRAPESDLLLHELRQVIFKSHRILYTVDATQGTVFVHYVRHGARRGIVESE